MKRKPKRPEPTWDQYPVWFVWVKKTSPLTAKPYLDLRSVCTNEALAQLHRDMVIRDEKDAEAILIEKRDTDHLYAQRDIRLSLSVCHDAQRWDRES